MFKHAIVGCVPRVQHPLLKLKLLRSPRLRSYRSVVKWELILSQARSADSYFALTPATPREEQQQPCPDNMRG